MASEEKKEEKENEPCINQQACNELIKFISGYDEILKHIEIDESLKTINQLLLGQIASGAQEVYILQEHNKTVESLLLRLFLNNLFVFAFTGEPPNNSM